MDGVQSNDILVICTSWESICWQGLGGSLVSLFPFKFQERRISYNDTLQPRYIRSVPPLLASSADQPQRLQHSPGIRSTSESQARDAQGRAGWNQPCLRKAVAAPGQGGGIMRTGPTRLDLGVPASPPVPSQWEWEKQRLSSQDFWKSSVEKYWHAL